MEKTSGQGSRLLALLRIFFQKTDDTHSLSIKQLIEELKQCGFYAERKTVYTDIHLLNASGFDIKAEKDGRRWGYHVASRHFELPELKLLVDSVQSSKFITRKKSRALIEKIEALASIYEANQLESQVCVSGRVKAENESIYYNVDKLQCAIEQDVGITFQYFQWTVEKQKLLRHEGKIYRVSPWALTWDNENYYLVGFDEGREMIRHYRVDKMVNVELASECRRGREQFDSYDLAAYTNRLFGMFDGEERIVRLRAQNDKAGIIFDRFGTELIVEKVDADCFEVEVKVAVSEQFLGWIISLGEKVRIVEPEDVVIRMRDIGERIGRMYG